MELKTTRIEREAFNRFSDFIMEREHIRILKDKNIPKPWTKNEILRGYHFTNVRREDDAVSRFLFNEWYPHFADQNNNKKWGAIMVARFINNPDSLRIILRDMKAGNYKAAKYCLSELIGNNKVIFRSAYLQPEIKGVTRLDKIFDILMPQIMEIDIPLTSLAEAVKAVTSIKYFGEFIAGQIVLDGIHVLDTSGVQNPWTDIHTFAPIGPGSVRGLNRLRERDLKSKMKRPQYETEISELHICPGMADWRAFDLEHALCEWDKYERLLWGQGSYNRKR